jgi:eukaryotic-like serine/threonine-protein kinase
MGSRDVKMPRPYRVVGRYRVYAELASGGMATVHLGCLLGPAGFSKLVAIKCLHQEFAAEPEFVAMFLDEARLASTIHHPNVVASLDVVAEQGELLVVMEYVHGETLAGLLRLSRQKSDLMPVPVVVRVLCDALDGLHAAHIASQAGRHLSIVHRDVSPQNIMVGADGNTRVLDFGIAQAALRSQATAAGTVKGKVAYMSPEQVQGMAVDARTDVFAAGIVLWEALTGRRLFFSPDSREIVNLLLRSPIAAPSSINSALSPGLDGVVLKALARDANQRFQSAHDFAEALREIAEEGSRREVAAWVTSLAADGLAHRLELLQALEASAIHTQVAVPLPVVTGSAPHAALAPQQETTQGHTQATTSTSILPHPPPARWRGRAPWAFAAGGVLTAVLVWLLAASSTPTPGAAIRGSEEAAASAPPVAPPAVVAPVKPAANDLPVVSADSMPLSPVVSAERKLVAKKPSHSSAVALRPAAVRGSSCNPPYRIDASGVRRIKSECL